jgi:hypothetical protein
MKPARRRVVAGPSWMALCAWGWLLVGAVGVAVAWPRHDDLYTDPGAAVIVAALALLGATVCAIGSTFLSDMRRRP